MENKDKIALNIANNIIFYRKELKLTQFELAEKLNYSDKSISKWERGEGIPDIPTLVELAKLFEVSLDQLVYKEPRRKIIKRSNKTLVSYFFASIVWVVASLIFAFFHWFKVPYPAWKLFVWAILGSSITLFTFNLFWKRKKLIFIYHVFFLWSTALIIFLHIPLDPSYLIFILAFVLQICLLLMFYIIYKPFKK